MASAVNLGYHQAAGNVVSGGAKKDEQRTKEQWDEYQVQQGAPRIAKSNAPEDPYFRSSMAKTASRRRTESHSVPQPHANASIDAEGQRRFSSASYRNSTLLPTHADSQPEIRRLSGNFNAPTHIEVEMHDNHQKSLKKWQSRIKRWLRA